MERQKSDGATVASCAGRERDRIDKPMWMLLAAIAGGATPSDDQRLDSLARAFEAQSAQVSELSRRVDMQRAEIAELRAGADQSSRPSTKAAAGVRASVSASGGADRQLTEAAQSPLSMWHESIYHTFEDPSSLGCNLPADESVGPIDMRRMADGTIATKYKTTAGSSTVAPMVLTHPPGCENATLHLQMDTTVPHLVVGGIDVAAALVELGCRTDGTGCIPTPPTSPPTSPSPSSPPDYSQWLCYIEGAMNTVCAAGTEMPLGETLEGDTEIVEECRDFLASRNRGWMWIDNWGTTRPAGCWSHGASGYFNTGAGGAMATAAPVCKAPC